MGEKQSKKDLPSGFWINEDGKLCWGDECFSFKPDGKNLRVSINPDKCEIGMADAYEKMLKETIGKGGQTIFEIPAKIEKEASDRGKAK